MIPMYSFKLNFCVENILNKNWKKPFFNNFFIKNCDTKQEWEEILTPDFLSLIDSKMPITRLMIFNKPSNWSSPDAHIDPGVIFALNIVINDTNAKMQWFSINNSEKKEINYSKANTPYLNYKEEELSLVHEDHIDNKVYIVRTDIPHRIKIGNSFRTCISIRFKHKFKNWNDVYDFYYSLGWIVD